MKQMLMNGREVDLQFPQEMKFMELMDLLQKNLNHQNSLVSIVRLDGKDLTQALQGEIEKHALSEFDQIEIFTSHPKDFAEEILGDLQVYCQVLQNISIQASEAQDPLEFVTHFNSLIEGLELFMDGVQGVKNLVHVQNDPVLGQLEVELLKILTPLLENPVQAQSELHLETLAQLLPAHLEQWKSAGIPQLIRSRDS